MCRCRVCKAIRKEVSKPPKPRFVLRPFSEDPENDLDLIVQDEVVHPKYGKGLVLDLEGEGPEKKATVWFVHEPDGPNRRFVVARSPLRLAGVATE